MITDKQFDDAFTAAGGWFFLTQFEFIKTYNGSKTELVDDIYRMGFDSKRTGSMTRVSSAIRIIDSGRAKEAILKIQNSKNIRKEHPEAVRMASELLSKYFQA
jgi:hypothetical protein